MVATSSRPVRRRRLNPQTNIRERIARLPRAVRGHMFGMLSPVDELSYRMGGLDMGIQNRILRMVPITDCTLLLQLIRRDPVNGWRAWSRVDEKALDAQINHHQANYNMFPCILAAMEALDQNLGAWELIPNALRMIHRSGGGTGHLDLLGAPWYYASILGIDTSLSEDQYDEPLDAIVGEWPHSTVSVFFSGFSQGQGYDWFEVDRAGNVFFEYRIIRAGMANNPNFRPMRRGPLSDRQLRRLDDLFNGEFFTHYETAMHSHRHTHEIPEELEGIWEFSHFRQLGGQPDMGDHELVEPTG